MSVNGRIGQYRGADDEDDRCAYRHQRGRRWTDYTNCDSVSVHEDMDTCV